MEENKKSLFKWLRSNRDVCVDVLRIYLGLQLFFKGLVFLLDEKQLILFMQQEGLPFFPYLTVHYAIIAHMGGGLMMMVGLLTRFAALMQIPILCGAVLFVNQAMGMFSTEQTLEFVMLVLFLLIFFTVYGSGRLSVDYLLARRFHKLS